MYSSNYNSRVTDFKYLKSEIKAKTSSRISKFFIDNLLIDKYTRDTRNNWMETDRSLTLKTWPAGGSQYSTYFEMELAFVGRDILQIKYRSSTQFKWREKVFKDGDGEPLDEIIEIIDSGLQHFEKLKAQTRSKEVKHKIDMISVHSRIGEIIGEDKEELINFHYNDNDMSFSPKKPGQTWRIQFLKHKSKKDSYSFKMKGRWNFNEEQLLKVLEGFLGAVKDPDNKKK